MVRCPGQVCTVCGGKGHSAKICTNVVTVFACEADASGCDSDGGLSGEEQDAFVFDASGKVFDEPGKRGRNALAWQMRDLPVYCDNRASCHMSHSSTGMINYREANATMRKASGKRYLIEGYGDLPLTFRSSSGGSASVALRCCTGTTQLPSSFPESRSRQRVYIRTAKIKTV